MFRRSLVPLVFLVTSAVPAVAQQAPAEPAPAAGAQAGPAQVEELRRRLDVLAAEVERLRSGETAAAELSEDRRRALGIAPSASAVFRRPSEGVTFAGYGEMLLEKYADQTESGVNADPTTRLDALRAVVYAGYRFNKRFLFNSEIEFEHGGEEVSVEFAYLDYLINEHLSLRGGMVLLPLGLTNEFHEPTVFIGTHRPATERRILPSTWHENGGGLVGSYGPVSFRGYLVNGFDAAGFTSAGVRGGRQGGVEAAAQDWGFAGRVDVTPVPGVFGGVGLYHGGADQGRLDDGGQSINVDTTISEFHGQAQVRGVDVRGLYARAHVDNAVALSDALGLPVNSPVAERMQGGYVQFGYNVLSQARTPLSLLPFVRIERVDTQNRVPAGYFKDLARDTTIKTFGVEFKPIPNIVIKSDYDWVSDKAGTGRNQFNVNLGYAF
jgi:hypothetical protein